MSNEYQSSKGVQGAGVQMELDFTFIHGPAPEPVSACRAVPFKPSIYTAYIFRTVRFFSAAFIPSPLGATHVITSCHYPHGYTRTYPSYALWLDAKLHLLLLLLFLYSYSYYCAMTIKIESNVIYYTVSPPLCQLLKVDQSAGRTRNAGKKKNTAVS